MKNMKPLLFLLLPAFISCKKQTDQPVTVQPDHVVSGTIYGQAFSTVSSKADKKTIDFNESGYEIRFSSAANQGCGSPDDNFDVMLRVPNKVGKFKDQYYVDISNPSNSDGMMDVMGATLEIKSITATTITGTIDVTFSKINSHVDGAFTVKICN